MKKFCLIVILFCVFCVANVFANFFDDSVNTFSDDGKKLAFLNVEGFVTIWDLETYKEISSINLGDINVKEVKFLPNGKQIAFVDYFSNQISIFDILSGKLINKFEFKTSISLNKSFFSADGQTLILTSDSIADNQIKAVWFDLNTLKPTAEKTFKGDYIFGNSAKNILGIFTKENQNFQIISAKDGAEISNFSLETEKIEDVSLLPTKQEFSIKFSGNGNKVVFARKIVVPDKDKSSLSVGQFFNEILVYSVSDGKLLGKTRLEAKQLDKYPVFSSLPELSINFDGTLLNVLDVTGSEYNSRYISALTTVDLNTLKPLKSFTLPIEEENSIAFLPNGKAFIKSDESDKLSVFSSETQNQIATLYPNINGAEKIAVSADNTKYAAVSASGLIKIWNSQGVLLKKINSETSSAKFIAFNPNGQILITAHLTKTDDIRDVKLTKFKVWNVNSGALIREFSNKNYANKYPQNFLIFNNVGDRIITDCGEDPRILELCSWNINTGEFFVRAFPNEKNTVTMVWFDDKQPFNFNKLATRQPFDEEKENESFLWNYADASFIARKDNVLDFNENIKGKSGLVLMVLEGYGDNEYKFFRINANDELKLTDLDTQNLITSSDQHFGARFVTKSGESEFLSSNTNLSDSEKNQITKANILSPLNVIEIEDFESEDDNKKLESHTDNVTDFVFTTNGRGISTSLDKTIRVWDVKTGTELFQLK